MYYIFKSIACLQKTNFTEASAGQHPNQIILSARNLAMASGDTKYLIVNIETSYIRGQEFCVYDVACTFLSSNHNLTITPTYKPIRSLNSPFLRLKLAYLDEKGKDIDRYKIKFEQAADIGKINSLMYGSKLQYRCGPGQQFQINDTDANVNVEQVLQSSRGVLVDSINVTCNWDGKWSTPMVDLPPCVCK